MELRELTLSNFDEIVDLKVSPEQVELVADNCYSVAQAGLSERSWCRGIYVDDMPVGFLFVTERSKNNVYLCRFMIDAAHQRKGYGRRAIKTLVGAFSKRGFTTFEFTVCRDAGDLGTEAL